MGHYSTAKVLFEAGADPDPPRRLFRNIWDSNELKRMVKNLENYVDPEYLHPLVLNQAAAHFKSMDEMSNAEGLYRRVLEMWEKSIGVEHLVTIRSVQDLARVLQHQGKYEAAEMTYRRALKVMEKVIGWNHPDLFASIDDQACVFHIQKLCDEASVLYLEAIERHLMTL